MPTARERGLGGGSIPRPGGIRRDELPKFNRQVLEVLRQPLEEGRVTIARTAAPLSYPARCIFVGAMNPCTCAH